MFKRRQKACPSDYEDDSDDSDLFDLISDADSYGPPPFAEPPSFPACSFPSETYGPAGMEATRAELLTEMHKLNVALIALPASIKNQFVSNSNPP